MTPAEDGGRLIALALDSALEAWEKEDAKRDKWRRQQATTILKTAFSLLYSAGLTEEPLYEDDVCSERLTVVGKDVALEQTQPGSSYLSIYYLDDLRLETLVRVAKGACKLLNQGDQ